MRDHSKHVQVTRDEAIQAIVGACRFSPATEEVPLDQAFGRVLAEDVTAELDMPNCLTCRMDSVAVHWADFADGIPDTADWVRGRDWEFANTGVGMPEGFDTAIVIEHCQVSDDDTHVAFDAAPSAKGAGTTPAGSRMRKGDVLAKARTVVTPLIAAHIASGNNTRVRVVAKPKVAFLPTGNELVAAGSDVPRGKNIDSNSLLMKGKLEQWGAEPIMFPITPDEPARIEAALRDACAQADIVVLNAGSSKGSDDYSLEVLERIGRVLYHETNHGPGHHSSCSVVDGTPVIGISGPPGGAAFTADFYVWPAVRTFLGISAEPQRLRVRLAEDFPARGAGGPKKSANEAPKGEERPSVAKPAQPFMGIKQVVLTVADDGVVEARPTASGRPAPPEAEGASAYYGLVTGSGAQPVHAGDVIEVTLRPEFGFAE